MDKSQPPQVNPQSLPAEPIPAATPDLPVRVRLRPAVYLAAFLLLAGLAFVAVIGFGLTSLLLLGAGGLTGVGYLLARKGAAPALTSAEDRAREIQRSVRKT